MVVSLLALYTTGFPVFIDKRFHSLKMNSIFNVTLCIFMKLDFIFKYVKIILTKKAV